MAGIGERDMLVADFGPTNAFRQHKNSDGVVWRVTPEGKKTPIITGIGDPNAVLIKSDGQILITDDATNEIFIRDLEGNLKLFSTLVNHPNGIVFSKDESILYVAQIFKTIRPVIMDGTLWALPIEEGMPSGESDAVQRSGEGGAYDGLVMDELGRVYIAANRSQQILRYDPKTKETIVITEGIKGIASLAFGRGEWDHKSIYGVSTFNDENGKRVWKIPVGVVGGPVYFGKD